MPVVTISGQIGSGAREIGPKVAQLLEVDYVDRLILAEAGKRVGATVAALAEKEERPASIRDRIARLIQRILERSAVAGAETDPFFGPSLEALTLRPYPETEREPITRAQELDDQRFAQVLSEVIKELGTAGNVVILGRASNLILKDVPKALHVNTIAPMSLRVKVVMDREKMTTPEAERYIATAEKARLSYFKRFFKCLPDDPDLYHMVINTKDLDFDYVAEVIAKAALLRKKVNQPLVD